MYYKLYLFALVVNLIFLPRISFAEVFSESFDNSSFEYAALYGPAAGSEGFVDKMWVDDNLNGDKALSVNWSAANDVGHAYFASFNKTIYSMSFYVMPKDGKMIRLRLGQNHTGGYLDFVDIVFNSFGADGIELVSGKNTAKQKYYIPRISRTAQTKIEVGFDYSFEGSTCNITMSALVNGKLYQNTGIAIDAVPLQLFFYFYSGVGDASLVFDDLLISTQPAVLAGNAPVEPDGYEPSYPSYRRDWVPDKIHLLSWADLSPGTTEPAPYGFAREQNLTWLCPILYNGTLMGNPAVWDPITNRGYEVLDNKNDEFNKLIIVKWQWGVQNSSGYFERNFNNNQYVELIQYWATRALEFPAIKGIIFDDFTGTDKAYLKSMYDAKTAINPDFKIFYQAYLWGPVDYSFVENFPKTGYYDGYVLYPRFSPSKVFYTYEILRRTYLDTGKKPILGLYVSGTTSMTDEYGRTPEEIGIATRQGIIAESEGISGGITFYTFVGQQLQDTGKNVMAEISRYKSLPVIRAPEAPRNLRASAGNRQVSLSWQAPSSENGSPLTGYRIYRGTSSGSEAVFAEAGTVLSYNDTNIPNGGIFFYKISALNAAGESALSNEVIVEAKSSLDVNKPFVHPIPYVFNKDSKLTFSNLENPSKIEIFSVNGSLVWSKEVNSTAYSFIPKEMSSGVYIYMIQSPSGKNNGKIVIIK